MEEIYCCRYDTFNCRRKKREGAYYTPTKLANFVAMQICEYSNALNGPGDNIRILDPASGDGELLKALLVSLRQQTGRNIEAWGFDKDEIALNLGQNRIDDLNMVGLDTKWRAADFLEYALEFDRLNFGPLFRSSNENGMFDMIIANPPYVRTQVLGRDKARSLASQYNIEGRVDLYQAFLLALSSILKPAGVVGVIVSNRFLTTQTGASVRKALLEKYEIMHVWDLGDTKLFEAAVLPAVLVMKKPVVCKRETKASRFTSVYSQQKK